MSNRGRGHYATRGAQRQDGGNSSPVANFTGPRSPQNQSPPQNQPLQNLQPRVDTNSPANVLQALEGEVVPAQEPISNQPQNQPGLEEKVAQEFDKMNEFIRNVMTQVKEGMELSVKNLKEQVTVDLRNTHKVMEDQGQVLMNLMNEVKKIKDKDNSNHHYNHFEDQEEESRRASETPYVHSRPRRRRSLRRVRVEDESDDEQEEAQDLLYTLMKNQ
jgi:hypothetical protein